jgi:hypothetical protein
MFGLPPVVAALMAATVHAGGGALGKISDRAVLRWAGGSCSALAVTGIFAGRDDPSITSALVALSCAAMTGCAGLHVARVGGTAAANHIIAAQAVAGVSAVLGLDQAHEAWTKRPM